MKKILSGNFRLNLYDQTYFDFSHKTQLFHLIDRDRSLNGFIDESKTEEKLNGRLINVFTQIEIDTSQKIGFFRKLGFLETPKMFLNRSTTKQFFKFDADYEICPIQHDAMNVKYAQYDYHSFYPATLPRQDHFAKLTKKLLDPIQPFPMVPHHNWFFSHKIKPVEISRSVFYYSTSEKQGDCKN